MLDLYDKITEAQEVIAAQWPHRAEVGIILGTGLGPLVDAVEIEAAIDYADIPHFSRSTATSHRGRLVCGRLANLRVMVMEGRQHMYEGYPLKQVTLPVRVMKAMGADLLMISNACGGLNPRYRSGDIMMIDDHINLMGDNPLIGINDDRLGPRFPDMSQPYDPIVIDDAQRIARVMDLPLHRGVFVAVAGPNLETRAEYRFLRQIGADVVGMSTVPENIVAIHSGMRVAGFSVITDMCLPDALAAANIEEIIAIANRAAGPLRDLIIGVLEQEAIRRGVTK